MFQTKKFIFQSLHEMQLKTYSMIFNELLQYDCLSIPVKTRSLNVYDVTRIGDETSLATGNARH